MSFSVILSMMPPINHYDEIQKQYLVEKYTLNKQTINSEIGNVNKIDIPEIIDDKHTYGIKIDNCRTIINNLSQSLNKVGFKEFSKGLEPFSELLNIAKDINKSAQNFNIASYSGIICSGISFFIKLCSTEQDQKNNPFSQLANLYIKGAKLIMNKLDLLNDNIEKGFMQLNEKLDEQHNLLKIIFSKECDIEWFIKNSNLQIVSKLMAINQKLFDINVEISNNALLVTNNFNSFRYEKIDELISQINFEINIGKMTDDRVMYFLPLVYNAIFNIAVNRYITGKCHSISSLHDQIIVLNSENIHNNLIGYFCDKLKYDCILPHPVLWKSLSSYAFYLASFMTHKYITAQNDKIVSMGVELLKFKDILSSNISKLLISNKPMNSMRQDIMQKYSEQFVAKRTQKLDEHIESIKINFNNYLTKCNWQFYTLQHDYVKSRYTFREMCKGNYIIRDKHYDLWGSNLMWDTTEMPNHKQFIYGLNDYEPNKKTGHNTGKMESPFEHKIDHSRKKAVSHYETINGKTLTALQIFDRLREETICSIPTSRINVMKRYMQKNDPDKLLFDKSWILAPCIFITDKTNKFIMPYYNISGDIPFTLKHIMLEFYDMFDKEKTLKNLITGTYFGEFRISCHIVRNERSCKCAIVSILSFYVYSLAEEIIVHKHTFEHKLPFGKSQYYKNNTTDYEVIMDLFLGGRYGTIDNYCFVMSDFEKIVMYYPNDVEYESIIEKVFDSDVKNICVDKSSRIFKYIKNECMNYLKIIDAELLNSDEHINYEQINQYNELIVKNANMLIKTIDDII